VDRYFGTLFLSLILIAASTISTMADHGQLSGEQIKTTLTNAKAKAETSSGKPYRVRFAEDGTVKFSLDDNSYADRGRWTVEGNQYCAQWEKIRKGAKACWHIKHSAGVKYVFKGIDGAPDLEAVISK